MRSRRGCCGGSAKPTVETALRTHELHLRLLKIEAGVEQADVLAALVNFGVGLVLGGALLDVGVGGAGLKLGADGGELLGGELLLEAGDLGLGGKRAGAASQLAWPSWSLMRALSYSAKACAASAADSAALSLRARSKMGQFIWMPDAGVVVLEHGFAIWQRGKVERGSY